MIERRGHATAAVLADDKDVEADTLDGEPVFQGLARTAVGGKVECRRRRFVLSVGRRREEWHPNRLSIQSPRRHRLPSLPSRRHRGGLGVRAIKAEGQRLSRRPAPSQIVELGYLGDF